MKRIVSVSMGSSSRDKRVETRLLNQDIIIERIGVDGDLKRAEALLRSLDGQVDAFGMGGIDFGVYSSRRHHLLKDAQRLVRAAGSTPIVDGSGVKNSLERKLVEDLEPVYGIPVRNRHALVASAAARHALAEAFIKAGAHTVLGDFMFLLGLPVRFTSLKRMDLAIDLMAPLLCQLPSHWLVPVGEAQTKPPRPRFEKDWARADFIAGDFHMLHRYLPAQLAGKIIVTNTATEEETIMLTERGVAYLVTTSPKLNGRSFATNVLEAALIALAGKLPGELKSEDYLRLFQEAQLQPRVERLN